MQLQGVVLDFRMKIKEIVNYNFIINLVSGKNELIDIKQQFLIILNADNLTSTKPLHIDYLPKLNNVPRYMIENGEEEDCQNEQNFKVSYVVFNDIYEHLKTLYVR